MSNFPAENSHSAGKAEGLFYSYVKTNTMKQK